MNTGNSYLSLSMSEKRKRLMAMVNMRKKMKRKKTERTISMLENGDNGDKINSKKPINKSSTKKKKLNSHTYKKMFQKARRKNEQGPTNETEEYWVPVHLSFIQIEQYCSLLHSNFEALSSSLRNTSSLHDILTETQKCCDHPYLVNPNLRESLKTNTPLDQLDAEINASGKLQLLDKLLLEIKRCGLRVLVLFQSVGSSKHVSTGDILDDLVDQRFGQNSYIRIHGKIICNQERRKRKEDLKMFNNLENGKFVCLMDYRACHWTIKLSSVDVVILFNSDWNPSNDVKALHRITIDSQRNRLRIFRLYSSFTIEEKALILSKQGTIYDGNSHRISYNNYHRLLAWGASYLFSKLSINPSSESKSNSNSYFIDDLVHVLMSENGSRDRFKISIVSKAQLSNCVYSQNTLLFGETEEHTKEICSIEDYLTENEPLVFWTELFKESPWKNSRSRLSRRVQKSFRNPNYRFEGCETENETETENFYYDATNFPSVKKRLRRNRKVSTEVDESTTNTAECTNDQPPQPQTSPVTPPVPDQSCNAAPLETELENINKEKEQVTKLYNEKKLMLISECEKELLEIRKKYDALIEESEMCLTKEMKVLEGYYHLVYANKVLAENLTRKCDDTFEEETERETDSVRIVEVPGSVLVQSENRCTTRIPAGHSLSGTGLRGPAPHLRSSPSLFASLPPLSKPQTQTEMKNVDNQANTENVPEFQPSNSWHDILMEYDSVYDMGCPSLPFLDSN